MTDLRLGVIGLSEGNGHPYSWSAIFNGYDPEAMRDCPFPAIPQYLARQRFPEDAISGARVTHIWTQDRAASEHVARASLIAHVVDDPRDMLPHIDALLLARDDAENHFRFAAPCLQAGIPIYVDKPLALAEADARRLIELQRWPGQLFTCSALRYGREFQLTADERERLGALRLIAGIVPKDWDRYAVHVIDPALCLMLQLPAVTRTLAWRERDITILNVAWDNGVCGSFTALGKTGAAPIALRLVGEKGSVERVFIDSFAAFRRALSRFIDGVHSRKPVHDVEIDLAAARLIEAGRREVFA